MSTSKCFSRYFDYRSTQLWGLVIWARSIFMKFLFYESFLKMVSTLKSEMGWYFLIRCSLNNEYQEKLSLNCTKCPGRYNEIRLICDVKQWFPSVSLVLFFPFQSNDRRTSKWHFNHFKKYKILGSSCSLENLLDEWLQN